MALITAAEARAFLPSNQGTADDALLDTLIARCGAFFARYCGYPPASAGVAATMETATYTRYLDGNGTRDLRLGVAPVQSVTSIYDDVDQDFAAATLVASGDYAITDANEALIRLTSTAAHGQWNKSKGTIKATFVAGFSTVPADVKQAAVLQVQHWYGLRGHGGKTSISVAGGGNAGLRDETMPPAVRQLLSAYRLPSVLM